MIILTLDIFLLWELVVVCLTTLPSGSLEVMETQSKSNNCWSIIVDRIVCQKKTSDMFNTQCSSLVNSIFFLLHFIVGLISAPVKNEKFCLRLHLKEISKFQSGIPNLGFPPCFSYSSYLLSLCSCTLVTCFFFVGYGCQLPCLVSFRIRTIIFRSEVSHPTCLVVCLRKS